MKKLFFFSGVLLAGLLHAQCFVQAQWTNCYCFGDCNGTATAYPANMQGNVTYLWLPGGQTTQSISGLCVGTYTVQAMDTTGCVATTTVTITSPTQLQAQIINVNNPSCSTCCDGSMTASASGGTPVYSYTWWTPSGPPLPMTTISNLCAGTYTLCVTDVNGCSSCTTQTISAPLGSVELANPIVVDLSQASGGQFHLNAQFAVAEQGEIIVTNMLGQVISVQTFSDQVQVSSAIDLTTSAPGMYFISVVTNEGTLTRQIMRE